MADTLRRYWQSGADGMLPRRDRRSGHYDTYVPDHLGSRPLLVGEPLAIKAARTERAVRDLSHGAEAGPLEGLSRFLLRSEAIASSMIEGIAPSPQQVALAELAQEEAVRGFSDQARLVANNITVLRRASRDLVEVDAVTVGDIVDLHTALLPDEKHRGLRRVQNWIGGSNWHPLDADFVPPPWEHVDSLMDDLAGYLNGSVHSALIQAALVHAQFETIHPFTDGNGRVGRALIHTVLTRRSLTSGAILPVSLVLATLRHTYVEGLTAYRYLGDGTAEAAVAGVERWLDVFLEATLVAAENARRLATDIQELRSGWTESLAAHRADQGRRQVPRSDSATARILAMLPEVPIMTTGTAQRLLTLSFPPARAALEELADAQVLTRKSVERNITGYLANDVFNLVGHAERRLASTRFDTRTSLPNRPVAARPES